MSRQQRDMYPNSNVRVDARVGESKAYGIRNAQRDMSGNVTGGIMPDGTRFGMNTTPVKTPAPAWKPAAQGPASGGGERMPFGITDLNSPAPPATPQKSITPRLDRSPTPKLDATRDPAMAGESFAQTDARKRAESARSGAFGARPQNLQGRKDLFGQMEAAGGNGITPDMQKQAKKLEVSDAAWNRVSGRMKAKANATPSIMTGKMESPSYLTPSYLKGTAKAQPMVAAAPSAPAPAPVPANKPTPIIPAPVRPTSGTALAQQPPAMDPLKQSPAWMRPMPTRKPMATPPARPAAPPSTDPLERRMTGTASAAPKPAKIQQKDRMGPSSQLAPPDVWAKGWKKEAEDSAKGKDTSASDFDGIFEFLRQQPNESNEAYRKRFDLQDDFRRKQFEALG